jgi:hypothetical protein
VICLVQAAWNAEDEEVFGWMEDLQAGHPAMPAMSPLRLDVSRRGTPSPAPSGERQLGDPVSAIHTCWTRWARKRASIKLEYTLVYTYCLTFLL